LGVPSLRCRVLIDVVQERVEEERRYEAFVADEADGRSRSGPAGVRESPTPVDVGPLR
jgi:hypothetical protein